MDFAKFLLPTLELCVNPLQKFTKCTEYSAHLPTIRRLYDITALATMLLRSLFPYFRDVAATLL